MWNKTYNSVGIILPGKPSTLFFMNFNAAKVHTPLLVVSGVTYKFKKIIISFVEIAGIIPKPILDRAVLSPNKINYLKKMTKICYRWRTIQFLTQRGQIVIFNILLPSRVNEKYFNIVYVILKTNKLTVNWNFLDNIIIQRKLICQEIEINLPLIG